MPGLSASLTELDRRAIPDKACRSGIITLIFGGFIEDFSPIARSFYPSDGLILH
jgi:hypothetical protein